MTNQYNFKIVTKICSYMLMMAGTQAYMMICVKNLPPTRVYKIKQRTLNMVNVCALTYTGKAYSMYSILYYSKRTLQYFQYSFSCVFIQSIFIHFRNFYHILDVVSPLNPRLSHFVCSIFEKKNYSHPSFVISKRIRKISSNLFLQ